MSRGYITLTTDFGNGDFEAGVLKGVIWNIAPEAKIADLSHDIPPQNILEAAFLLGRSTPYFPTGSIHVVVVDPGVGTSRRPIAAQLGPQWFVGPDNGVFTMMLEHAEAKQLPIGIGHLDRRQYWLSEVSDVFHGRDIFSPAAAHLATGVPLAEIGTPISDPVRLKVPKPEHHHGIWHAQVVHIDIFGNIGTNLKRDHLAQLGDITVHIADTQIHGLVETFGDRPVGELVALIDSENDLAICVVNGNAAQKLNVKPGDWVEVSGILE